MSKRVLIGVPDLRNVPYFAMGHPSARANLEEEGELDEAAKLIGGGNHLRKLKGSNAPPRLLNTRTFVPPKSALYTMWLEFRDDADADQFLASRSHLGLAGMLRANETRYAELRKELTERTAAGDFDLGRISERKRLSAAQDFVRKSEELSALEEDVRALKVAKEVFETV